MAAVRDADPAHGTTVTQDEEQKEAAEMDGAGAFSKFIYITLPHLARPITVVILIKTIFLLTVFAEIFVTTGGGPGLQTTNIAFLIYSPGVDSVRRRKRLGRRIGCGGDRQRRGLLPGADHRTGIWRRKRWHAK